MLNLVRKVYPIVLVVACFALTTALPEPTFGKQTIKAYWSQKNKRADIDYLTFDGVAYISIKDLASFLGADYSTTIKNGKAEFTIKDKVIGFTNRSPYVIVGDKSYNLIYDIRFSGGEFFAPGDAVLDLLGRFLNFEYDINLDKKTLNIFPSDYNIVDLNSQLKLNGLLIEIFLTKLLKYEVSKTIDSWLIINIHDGKLNPEHFANAGRTKVVLETKAYQFDNSAQISLRLKAKDFNIVHRYKDDPPRIQISVKASELSDTVLTYVESDLPAQSAQAKDSLIDIVVIDPGHGGDDEGAIGRSGLMEKDVVLDIAKKLRTLLQQSGFKVILTRDDDRFVSLADRAEIANEANADIFISIHCNAAENKSARGSIVFFLADAKTDQARAAAALENASFKFESTASASKNSDIDFIISDLMQTEHLKESAELAEIIHGNFKNIKNLERRGIDQAGFLVLNKVFMPSVLVETAFITNKNDEALLQNEKFRDSVAREITAAVVAFKTKYETRR